MAQESGVIAVTCDTAHVELAYTWNDLEEFQGDLKDLTLSGFENLKKSLVKHGFFMPVFIWKGNKGERTKKPYLIDGHQRKRVFETTEWAIEGGKVPTIAVTAETPQLAAELVLRFDSQHGTRTSQGLYSFISAHALTVDDLSDLDLPDLNLSKFKDEFFTELDEQEEDFREVDEDLKTDHECPQCGYGWSGKSKIDKT
jgi:hypothetical protein